MDETGLKLALSVEAFAFSSLFAVSIYSMGMRGFDPWKTVVTVVSALEVMACFGHLIVGKVDD